MVFTPAIEPVPNPQAACALPNQCGTPFHHTPLFPAMRLQLCRCRRAVTDRRYTVGALYERPRIRRKTMIRKVALGWFATIVLAVSAPAQSYYEVQNIGVLSGQTSSTALDINNKGVVVGRSG